MPERVPTKKQFDLMLMLGSGAALVVGQKGRIAPLIRHGWVTSRDNYCWVRITADGLRALAAGVERYGLPEFNGSPGPEGAPEPRPLEACDCGSAQDNHGWACRCSDPPSKRAASPSSTEENGA